MQYLLTLHVSDHVSCIMHVRKKLYIYTIANIAFQLENIKLVGRTVRKMSILIDQGNPKTRDVQRDLLQRKNLQEVTGRTSSPA